MRQLGGWAIGEKLFTWIMDNVPQGSKILEMGSGIGSHLLGKYYDMHCVEHDTKWLDKYDNITYYHAPLENKWYKRDIVDKLPKDYDVLLIDGPPGNVSNRSVVQNYVEELKMPGKIVIVDDMQRESSVSLFLSLWADLGSGETTIFDDKGKKFGIIYPDK